MSCAQPEYYLYLNSCNLHLYLNSFYLYLNSCNLYLYVNSCYLYLNSCNLYLYLNSCNLYLYLTQDDEGSKRKLTAVFAQLERLGHDTESLWARIEQIVAKTLVAVVGELKVEMQAAVPSGKPGPTCFQVSWDSVVRCVNVFAVCMYK